MLNIKRCNIFHLNRDSRGSALVLVLVIVTVVTVIVNIMLIGSLLHLHLIKTDLYQLQAQYLAEAGVYKTMWYLSGRGGKDYRWRPKNEVIELPDGYVCTVSVEQWGGYLRVVSTAQYAKATKKLQVLVGEKPSFPFQQAIFIGGTDYPLVVAGKNRIIGDVTLGKEGVRQGTLPGTPFQSEQLVNGRIYRQPQPKLPYFNAFLLESTMTKNQLLLDNPQGQEIFHSQRFDQTNWPTFEQNLMIYVHGDLYITGEVKIQGPGTLVSTGNLIIADKSKLEGSLWLISGGKMIIRNGVRITGCLLSAQGDIEISDRCKIIGQLFSSGDIILRNHAEVGYPAVIYSVGTMQHDKIEGKIILQDQAIVRGTIIFCSKNHQPPPKKDETIVIVEKEAKVIGVIYSENNTTVHGTVYGTVITGKFFLYEPPTIYLNWLKDATIDRTKLPNGFLLPLTFTKTPHLDVVIWQSCN